MLKGIRTKNLLFLSFCILPNLILPIDENNEKSPRSKVPEAIGAAVTTAGLTGVLGSAGVAMGSIVTTGAATSLASVTAAISCAPILPVVLPTACAVGLIVYFSKEKSENPIAIEVPLDPAEQEMHDAIRATRGANELEKVNTELAQNQTKAVEAQNELQENRLRLEENNRQLQIVAAQKALETCLAKNRNNLERTISGRPTACQEDAYILTMAAGSREALDRLTKLFNDLNDNK